jgi:hypothetical protein
MSRIWFATVLFVCASVCQAQRPGEAPPLSPGPGPLTDVRSKATDPSAVEIPLYSGAAVRDVLQALSDKGFTIKWNDEDVLPTMKLLERPKATRVDKLLTEILQPWGLRADHNIQDGGYRVRPVKKKKEVIVGDPEPPATAGAAAK